MAVYEKIFQTIKVKNSWILVIICISGSNCVCVCVYVCVHTCFVISAEPITINWLHYNKPKDRHENNTTLCSIPNWRISNQYFWEKNRCQVTLMISSAWQVLSLGLYGILNLVVSPVYGRSFVHGSMAMFRKVKR